MEGGQAAPLSLADGGHVAAFHLGAVPALQVGVVVLRHTLQVWWGGEVEGGGPVS